MEKSVRTAIGAKLQTAQKHNLPYLFDKNSVMNEQVQVLPDEVPARTPWVQFLAIGIGGLSARIIGDNRRLELVPLPHEPRHTGLYEQIPFVIRPIDQDLTSAERAQFRLRAVVRKNNQDYAYYWLRRMNLATTEVTLEYREITDGNVTSVRWEPTPDDQHPTPRVVNPGQVLVTGDDYVAASSKSVVRFTPWDVNELVNVGKHLFGSETAITVSELALCSGIDIEARAQVGGASVPITEAIGVQITDFVSTLLPAAFNRSGATINLDSGSVEPLLALKAAQ